MSQDKVWIHGVTVQYSGRVDSAEVLVPVGPSGGRRGMYEACDAWEASQITANPGTRARYAAHPACECGPRNSCVRGTL